MCLNPLFQAKELEACIKFTGVKTLFLAEKIRDFSLYKVLEQVFPNLAQSQSGQVKSEKFPDLKQLVIFSEQHYPGTYRYVDVFNAGKQKDYAEVEILKNSVQTFDPAQLVFTSGTTGTPKAVILTHHAIINGLRFMATDLILDQVHVHFCFAIFFPEKQMYYVFVRKIDIAIVHPFSTQWAW